MAKRTPMQVDVKKDKNEQYTVTFKGLTEGAVLAMRNALLVHEQNNSSAVASDLRAFLEPAAQSIGVVFDA